ncbi:MAG: hypothetical protein AB7S72_09890 [Draconibacterium sp.]
MKFILLITSLFVVVVIGNAQIKKHKSKHENYIETFYIDKKTGMMEGSYKAENPDLSFNLANGNYFNGVRTGVWTYYSPLTSDKLIEYDYSNDSLLYFDKNSFANFYLINNGEKFDLSIVDRPFIFLGFHNELLFNIVDDVPLSKNAKNGETGISLIGYTVDEKGNITGSKVVESFDSQSEQKINAVVNRFNGRIIPPICNGNPVKSIFYIKVNWNGFSLTEPMPYIYEINMNVINHHTFRSANDVSNSQINGPLERQFEYQDKGNQLR